MSHTASTPLSDPVRARDMEGQNPTASMEGGGSSLLLPAPSGGKPAAKVARICAEEREATAAQGLESR